MKTNIVILVIGVALIGLASCTKTNEIQPRKKCNKDTSTSNTTTSVTTDTRG